MIAAAALFAYAVLLLVLGAPLLARAWWPARAPRLAVYAWLGLTGSAVASVALAGVALTLPGIRVSASLASLVDACVMSLRAQYAHPGGAALAGGGAALTLAVTARLSWCAVRTLTTVWLARRRHRRGLALAGRPDGRLGAIVVDHAEAAAWCLPGARGLVVLTSAAIAALDGRQIAAVLAHERAHQRGHHHLLVAAAWSLAVAFPRVRAFRTGHEQVARLVELLADDAAAAECPRLTVAEALLALGTAVPAGAAVLGAGGTGAAARVRRLIAAPAPVGRLVTAAGILAIAAAAAFPLAVLAGPAVAASGKSECPLQGQHAVAVVRTQAGGAGTVPLAAA